MTDYKELIARKVYEAMMWAYSDGSGNVAPEWVPGGNSIAQDRARSVAADALEAQAEQVAVVAPLEWKYFRDPKDTSEARTQIGSWTIWEINGSAYCYGPDDTCGRPCGDGLDKAKAAAQADYERRILSALTIRSADEVRAEGYAAGIEAASQLVLSKADEARKAMNKTGGQSTKWATICVRLDTIVDDLSDLHTADSLAALERVRQEERERCHKIALEHRPERPLQSRATADAIAAAIMGGEDD